MIPPDVPTIPFDAVLFDLDGTLVATERFWPDAARAGALQAFGELGLDREPPTRSEWMSLVGRPLDEGFDELFPDLEEPVRRQVQARCVEMEHELLADGRAAVLPGVVETLETLHAAGVRMGIASNCSQGYLDAMMGGLGLDRWIDEARCLHSPGIRDKAGMVEDLLFTFDTRRAVMVGDRGGDRDAAWENGIPHVHLSRGYALAGEEVSAEATIEGMDALLRALGLRARMISEAATALALAPGSVVGVSGTRASGKTLFADELAGELSRSGTPSRVVALEGFRTGRSRGPEDPFAGAFDLQRLSTEVLDPHEQARATGEAEVLILEGPHLVHPALAVSLDRLIWLDGPEEVRLRRLAGRDARVVGPVPVMEARAEDMPLERALVAAHPPSGPRILRLDQGNLLVPAPARA